MPTIPELTQTWLNQPSPPSRRIVPVQRLRVTKQSSNGVEQMACSHEYVPVPNYTDPKTKKVVINQSICPREDCRKPDFRRLKCRHCERPQSDTGTCPGH